MLSHQNSEFTAESSGRGFHTEPDIIRTHWHRLRCSLSCLTWCVLSVGFDCFILCSYLCQPLLMRKCYDTIPVAREDLPLLLRKRNLLQCCLTSCTPKPFYKIIPQTSTWTCYAVIFVLFSFFLSFNPYSGSS